MQAPAGLAACRAGEHRPASRRRLSRRRFPIGALKVERAFIRAIPKDAEDRAISEAIGATDKGLGLTTVAERRGNRSAAVLKYPRNDFHRAFRLLMEVCRAFVDRRRRHRDRAVRMPNCFVSRRH
jgi:hypothetical protein